MSLLSRIPLHPLMADAYAVLYVYAANLSEVVPADLVAPLGRTLIAGGTVFAFAILVFRNPRRGAIVATAIIVAFYFFGHLTRRFAAVGLSENLQLLLWAGVVGAAVVYAWLAKGSLARATQLLNAFSLVLVLLSLVRIVPYEAGRVDVTSHLITGSDTPLATATRVPNRDIYFIVLDRYGSNAALDLRFGITDNDLPDWLTGQGFEVVPGARANYRMTDYSLASELSMRMLDDLTTSVGPASNDRAPLRARLKQSAVAVFLKANGYRYYHMGSWFGPTQTSPIADEVINAGQDTEFGEVLRQVSILPALDRILTKPADDKFRTNQRNIAEFQFQELERLASVPGRKYVFAHILMPHPPYVFHADGSPLLRKEADTDPEGQLFREQLAYTNARMREVVSALLAGPDESDPIIIIKGDEGPYMCRSYDCVDGSPRSLGVRYGVLGAYYLPGLPADTMSPDHTSVNDFRTVFRDYFGADLPDLPNRSFNWPDSDHLYEFHDITDQLPLPGK